jgi:hypothetical protein
MQLSIRGGNAFQKKIAAAAIEFAKGELMPKIRTLDVTLTIRKFKSPHDDDAIGWCTYEDDKIKHREFTIDVSSQQTIEAFIKTIMHEMIHVKQYANGEIRESFKTGELLVTWDNTDHTKTSYSRAPWEKEAYRVQNKLYSKFLKESMSYMI